MRDVEETGTATESDVLAGVFVGPFRHLAGNVRISRDGVPPAIPVARLLAPSVLERILDRYARRFGTADRRSVASLWSQYCFGVLIVPFIAAGLLGRRVLPLASDSASLLLEGGLPTGLVLTHVGQPNRSGEVVEGLEALLADRIAPLVASLAACSGASPRLFWSNAAVIADWALGEVEAMLPERLDIGPFRRRLLDGPTWTDGRSNPLSGPFRPLAGCPGQNRRRVCCVRYVLPGVPGCGSLCPLDR